MKKCTPLQRNYVSALLELGSANHKRAALMAGFSGNDNSLRVTAHRVHHDSNVQAAIREEAERRMTGATIMAASVLVETIGDKTQQTKDRLKAAEMLFNRTGLHAKSEHKMTVEHTHDDAAMVARIKLLADSLGLDARKMLGTAGVVVDAEFKVIEPAQLEAPEEPPAEDFSGLEDIL